MDIQLGLIPESVWGMVKAALGDITGTAFYVSKTGADGADGLSWETSLLTIDAAIAKCTAYAGDVILIAPSSAAYNENAATGGVICDIAGIRIIGFASRENTSVNVINTNGAATAVFTVTAENVIIMNLSIVESTGTVVGVLTSAEATKVGNVWFNGAMENGVEGAGGGDALNIHNCTFDGCVNGIKSISRKNVIIGNRFIACTTNGIFLTAGGNDGIVVNNVINGSNATTNGINTAGSDHYCANNFISNCTNNIVDTGARNYFGLSIVDWTNISNSENATLDAIFQKLAALWGADDTNTFLPIIDGSARATLEAALEAMWSGLSTGQVGTPDSGVIANLNDTNENDLVVEVTQATVAEIDFIYVDFVAWYADGTIAASGATLTIRFYLDDSGGTLREVVDLEEIVTEGLSGAGMIRIGPVGTIERNYRLTVQSSLAPAGGPASDLVKYHYSKYDRE